ncbi:MAG TPA: hypothetical protein VHB99_19540 [Pirellulales bacterium]|nr:hypothetical protein [Pirellulales bacterium]
MPIDDNPYRSPQVDDFAAPVAVARDPTRSKGTVAIAVACFCVAVIALSIGFGVSTQSQDASAGFVIFGVLAYWSLAFAAMGIGLLGRRKNVVIGGLLAIALSIGLPILIAVLRR